MSTISDEWQHITGPNAYAQLAVASCIAHSGFFNTRRLECLWYGFWHRCLEILVANLGPNMLIEPQLELDVFQVIHDKSIKLDDSISTLPQSKATKGIPDFGVLVALIKSRSDKTRITSDTIFDHYTAWDVLKAKRMKIGILMEIKKGPTRSQPNAEVFFKDLEFWQGQAANALNDQVTNAFTCYPQNERFILMACSGEWWRWKLAVAEDYGIHRDGLPPRRVALDAPEFQEAIERQKQKKKQAQQAQQVQQVQQQQNEEDTPVRERGGTDRYNMRAIKAKVTEADVEGSDANDLIPHANQRRKAKVGYVAKKADFYRHTPAGLPRMQRLLTDTEMENEDLHRKDWSGYILFGNAVSDQNLSYVRRFLKKTEESIYESNFEETEEDDAEPATEEEGEESHTDAGEGERSDTGEEDEEV
ncbi:hypothetical protein D9615_009710 [Tricholomella constricta]|uniref:Uncharacterized protein n=1 Tax=Tricholomella constricta TaxID=117010 RepID=A0A8H5GUR2_9AGAR|nr:hypothetical protein D9615_009710 [Tricholomella constricta]